MRILLATVVLAGALTAHRAGAVVHGFTVFEDWTNIVTAGSMFELPVLQGTYGADSVSGSSYRFRVGTDAAATNYLFPTSIMFYQDASNLITNGFYTGMSFIPAFSGLFDEGNGIFRVDLTLSAGYRAGTNRVFEILFEASNPDPTNVPVEVLWLYTGVVHPAGTWATSTGSKTWANTNDFFNPVRSSLVIVNPVPEPSVAAVLVVGAAVVGLAKRKRKRRLGRAP